MPHPTSIKGPVELINGKLTLCIPLDAGGTELIDCSRGISVVEGDNLIVEIKDWLAKKLNVTEGSIVRVDNQYGKFNITPVET